MRSAKNMANPAGQKCIKSGGPVGIVSEGKAYLVVGEHKPINDQLAEYCGKNITVKGKLAERGGIAMIENVESREEMTRASVASSSCSEVSESKIPWHELRRCFAGSSTSRSRND